MAGPWEKYAQPAAQPAGPWAKYGGDAPAAPVEKVVEQMPESMSGFNTGGLKGLYSRAIVKNLSNDPQASVKYLKERYPGMEVKLNEKGRLLLREPGKTDWNVLDPDTGLNPLNSSPTEIGKDIIDAGFDVGSGVASTAAAGAAAVPAAIATAPAGGIGALPAAALAGGATSASLEAMRQKLGNLFGLDQQVSGRDVALQGAVGAVSPLLFGTGVAAKSALSGAAKAGLSEAEQLAVAAAQRGIVPRIGSAVKGRAETMMFRALGPNAKAAEQNYVKGQIKDMGRVLLDEGMGGAKSYDTLAKQTAAKATQRGQELGKIVEQLDTAGPTVMLDDVAASTKNILGESGKLPGAAERMAKNDEFAAEFLKNNRQGLSPGGDVVSILDAEKLKREIGNNINWDRLPGADIPVDEKRFRALYTAIKKGSENAADGAANRAGGVTKTEFKEAKRIFGLLKEANKIVSKKAGKENALRLISPSDYLTGGIGAAGGFASGGSLEDRLSRAAGGASLGFANKLGRTYGNQLLAPAFDAAGNALMSSRNLPAAQSAWNLLQNNGGK